MNVDFVLYKGGRVEEDLCRSMGIESYNIELLSGLRKIKSHDPEEEVKFYMGQLWEMMEARKSEGDNLSVKYL